MAEKRTYKFIDSNNPAKRPRQGQSGGTGRRQGQGNYGEVSKRANDLRKGSGACWRCRYLKKPASTPVQPSRKSRVNLSSATEKVFAKNANVTQVSGGFIQIWDAEGGN